MKNASKRRLAASLLAALALAPAWAADAAGKVLIVVSSEGRDQGKTRPGFEMDEFALMDMRLHAEPGTESDLRGLVDAVRGEVAVVKPPAFNRFLNGFSHIFAGGYAAGYYSYKWAELLSADAWSAFEEEGVFNAATGKRFLTEVLEQGGARDAIDNFKAFRGREPQIDALLRHQGMA